MPYPRFSLSMVSAPGFTSWVRGFALVWFLGAFLVKAAPGEVEFDARVLQVSGFPKPVGNPYADCLFSVKVEPLPPPGAKPQPVVLALFAFTNRVLKAEAKLKPGDLVRVRAKPFDDMSESYRENQLQDDIAELELPFYAGSQAHPVPALALPLDPGPERPRDRSLVLRPPPPSPESARIRSERIASDLAQLRIRTGERPDWAAWHARLRPLRESLRSRITSSPVGFLRKDNLVLEHPSVLEYVLEDDDPWYRGLLRALANLQQQFARAGTDLILLPVPQRDEICAAAFVADPPADGILQPYWLKFHADLLRMGIESIDVAPVFRERLHTHPGLYLHAVRDGHPGPDGVEIMAAAVAERLARYAFPSPPHGYRLEPGHPVPMGHNLYYPNPVPVSYSRVLELDGRPALADMASELLVIGDSMVTVPLGAESGTFGVQLAAKCGIPVAPFKRAGSGHMMARHLAQNLGLDHFSGRRVCVFVFTSSYLNRRPQAWSEMPFLDVALERDSAGSIRDDWQRAGDLAALHDAASLARFFGPDTVARPQSAGGGVQVHGKDIPFPAWLAGGEEELWVRLQVRVPEAAQWMLREGGGRERPVEIPAGLSLVTFRVGRPGPGFRGLVLPGSPLEVFSLAIRVSSPAGTVRADDPVATRRLARYNAPEDFRLLRVSPPGGCSIGEAMILERGDRDIDFPARLRNAGAFPEMLLLEAETSSPCQFMVMCDGREVGRLHMPDFPGVRALPLPRGERMTLRIPASAGRVVLRSLELRAWNPSQVRNTP